MIKRVLMGILIAATFIGALLGGYFYDRWIMSFFLCIVIGVSVIEMRHALGDRIPKQFNILIWSFALLFGLAYFRLGFTGSAFVMMIAFAVGCAITIFCNLSVDALKNLAFLLIYPALAMSTLLFLNRAAPTHEHNPLWGMNVIDPNSRLTYFNTVGLSLVFVVSWFTDSFAYFVGSLMGKHKLCPQLSPKKTVEGAIGGLLGGLIGAGFVFLLFEVPLFGMSTPLLTPGLPVRLSLKILDYILIGLVGSFCTQIGDLTASLIKRNCGIKDYSNILGSHGGVMDRFDGIILNGCFVALIFSFIL